MFGYLKFVGDQEWFFQGRTNVFCAHDEDDEEDGIEPEQSRRRRWTRTTPDAAVTVRVKTTLKIILVALVEKRYLSWVCVRCVRVIYLVALESGGLLLCSSERSVVDFVTSHCFASTKYRLFTPFCLGFQIVVSSSLRFSKSPCRHSSLPDIFACGCIFVFSFLFATFFFSFAPASCPTPSSSSTNTDHFFRYG